MAMCRARPRTGLVAGCAWGSNDVPTWLPWTSTVIQTPTLKRKEHSWLKQHHISHNPDGQMLPSKGFTGSMHIFKPHNYQPKFSGPWFVLVFKALLFPCCFPWNPYFKVIFFPQICNKTNLNVLTIHLFSHKWRCFPHTFSNLLHLNIFKHTLEPMNKTVVPYWSGKRLHRLISRLPLHQSLSILTVAALNRPLSCESLQSPLMSDGGLTEG